MTMKQILIVLISTCIYSCSSIKVVESNVSCQVGKKKDYSTFMIKSPHEKKGKTIVVETSTVAIDSIKVSQSDKLIWQINNKDEYKVLAIAYGKRPINFSQIYPKDNRKPEKLTSGDYLIEVYLNNDIKKFNISVE